MPESNATSPMMQRAIDAVQKGICTTVAKLLADNPELVHERAVDERKYLSGFFHCPKLLWFVAFNPFSAWRMPVNMVSIAEAIIVAGAEPEDVTYTLELVMSSRIARENALQRPLMKLLLEWDAEVTPQAIRMALGHRERDAIRYLLERGQAMTVEIAAGMGMCDELRRLFDRSTEDQRHAAFSLAVINNEMEATRFCLEHGVNPNQFFRLYGLSMATHQSVMNGNVCMLQLLHQHGARFDVEDTIWDRTPLGWAEFFSKPAAEAYLRSIGAP